MKARTPLGRMTSSRSRLLIGGVASLAAVALFTGCAGSGGGDPVSTPSGLAEPGTDIPSVTVKAGFSPYADELLMVAGIESGYFEEVGITIDPAPYGAQTDLIAALTPLLNGQVELGSGYLPTIPGQLDSVENVVGFAIQDVFYGSRILAPAGKYTTIEEAMADGDTWDEALVTVLDQIKGQKLLLTEGGIPDWFELVTGQVDMTFEDFDLGYMSNSDMVRAAFAGQADFVAPGGAAQITTLQLEGWEPLIDLREIIDNMGDETVSLRSTYSGYLTTTEYAEDNWDTLLRMTSVMYRLIDDFEGDPQGTAAKYIDYLNSYTGSDLTVDQVAEMFNGIYSVRNFEDAAQFYLDESDPFFFDTVMTASIDSLVERGVLGEGHTPADVSIAGDIYESLVGYRAAADEALAAAPDGDLKTQAQAQYDARNYLDAYRLAAAASDS